MRSEKYGIVTNTGCVECPHCGFTGFNLDSMFCDCNATVETCPECDQLFSTLRDVRVRYSTRKHSIRHKLTKE